MKILRLYLNYLYRVGDTQCDSIGNLINTNNNMRLLNNLILCFDFISIVITIVGIM